ncbi:ribonuclease H-like protein [Cystobasidium minutum MCA 4210]|uniref:ribonuclease H-like protein n=1 Tax=Cystobasidium minutum MCA 4210 TaxID=1397322 RepID=UPI0034D00119|eukprot:jgi/Rhomi1/148016/e_gw1.10.177.1
MIITGSGKVIRKGPAPALQTKSTPSPTVPSSTSSSHTSSIKGKERASTASQSNGARPAPVAAFFSDAGPSRLPLNTPASYIPVVTRNAMVKAMYQELLRVYENFSPKQRHTLASEHALSQEITIYGKNNKFSYKTACIATIARLKKRPAAESIDETGTMEEYDKHIKDAAEAERDALTIKKALALTMNREAMLAHDYVVEVPEGPGGNIPTEEGGSMKCERCAADYIVHGNMTEAEQTACVYHWGRPEVKSDRSRRWNCCQMPIDAPGCTRGPHVFIEKTAEELHMRAAFLRTEDLHHPEGSRPLSIAALDCELIRTTAGMALARLTIVDEAGTKIFDEFIRPNGMVVDLVTRWSGVTEQDLEEKARINFEKLRRDVLGKYINDNTILIGHGLENDLKALRLVHPPGRVIDTTHLYPHSKGLPYRRALRFLVQEHLGAFIQDGGAAGHSSLVDARAALDLVKLKARKLVENGQAI